MISLIPYIGGKHRMASHILPHLQRDGVDTLVDVFGGSGAVTMEAAGRFKKIVYNDLSGDLVNLFRVLAHDQLRPRLLRRLKCLPPSRQVWQECSQVWVQHGFSFSGYADPVERAALTFYRHHYSFGGKVRCGGFSCSTGDREGIKEIVRYRNTLRRLSSIASLWRGVMIENLEAQDVISMYGGRPNVSLYCDPPYDGTEHYYTARFSQFQHTMLNHQLEQVAAHAVVSYYDTDLIRSLYQTVRWQVHHVSATKNASFRSGNRSASELIIVKQVSA